jgi:type III pantothenate kinase
MLLAIDIGNSTINLGLFGRTLLTRSVGTRPSLGPTEFGELLREFAAVEGMDKKPGGVIISSVVPALTGAAAEAARGYAGREPLILGPETAKGLKIDLGSPEELGPDRIAGAVAAADALGPPVAVVDLGTATTVGFVFPAEGHRWGAFRGGAIMPGLAMMGVALHEGTGRLPLVEPAECGSALGADTRGNILSGMAYGTAGAVRRIMEEVEAAEGVRFRVAATGGAMRFVLGHMGRVDLAEPHLTLKGLRLIYEGAR